MWYCCERRGFCCFCTSAYPKYNYRLDEIYNTNSSNNSSSSNKDDKKRNRNGRLLPLAHRALEVKMTVSVPVEFLPPRSRLLQQRWWRRVEKWAMERKTPQLLVEIVGRQVRQL